MKLWIAPLLVYGAFSSAAFCQEKLPPVYRLQFRLQETGTGGKAAAANHFALTVQNNERGKINASRRLPYYTSGKGEAKELHTAALGSIIECTPVQIETAVRLQCAFESSFVEPGQAARPVPAGFLPSIISRQASTTATIPLGKETRIASMDDLASRTSLEVYVTAERISSAQ